MKDRASFKAVLLIMGIMLIVLSFAIKKRKTGEVMIAAGFVCFGASVLV